MSRKAKRKMEIKIANAERKMCALKGGGHLAANELSSRELKARKRLTEKKRIRIKEFLGK